MRIEGTYDKPTGNIIQDSQKLSIFSKVRNKTRVPTLITPIQNDTGSLSQSKWARKRNKGIQTRKQKIKVCLFTDDIILYTENPRVHQE